MESLCEQRRYLLSFESRHLPHIFTDVLVIGAGAAGLRTAIEATSWGQVILTTKGQVIDSNTYLAQGGMAAPLAPEDSAESHIADTLSAGCGIGVEEVVRYVVAQAAEHIRQMQQWGVAFDTSAGELNLAREGGHSTNRIVHADGDATGRVLGDVLVERARGTADLKIFENCFVIDLVTDPSAGGTGATCIGALTCHPRYGLQMIRARQTILAGGGAGMLWRETSNAASATADAMAMAFRAGAQIADAEMMQFHPTTLYIAGSTRSLISEAVRGEGGRLVDRSGRRFMNDYHKMGDLAPRDAVSRAILEQMAKTNSTHVFLDVRHLPAAAFAERFPHIDGQCRSFGIRPAQDLIPVHPAAHYMIGGVHVDMDGRSSLAGLLACGEAACTGLHGANRLASNSLIEALIFGKRSAETAGAALAESNDRLAARQLDWVVARSERTELDLGDSRNSLRSLMWRNVGIVRRGERLAETLDIIAFWGRYVLDKEFPNPAGWEVQNMLTSAYIIARCALQRTETRGVHYREDYPRTEPDWARHQLARRTEEGLAFE